MNNASKSVHLGDNPDYDDRVRQLLSDLEEQSKNHIRELNDLHEHYRGQMFENGKLVEVINKLQRENRQAYNNERSSHQDNV